MSGGEGGEREEAHDAAGGGAGAAPVRVVAGVIAGAEPGTVMAFRRGPGRRHAGLWEFPGGKVEAGEGDRVALARELDEELGVAAEVGALLWDGPMAGVPGYEIAFYRCRIVGGDGPELRDHSAIALVRAEDAERFAWAPGDTEVTRAGVPWSGVAATRD